MYCPLVATRRLSSVAIPPRMLLATIDTSFEVDLDSRPVDRRPSWAELNEEERELINLVQIDESNTLTDEQRQQVREILSNYIDCFARNKITAGTPRPSSPCHPSPCLTSTMLLVTWGEQRKNAIQPPWGKVGVILRL